MYNSPEYRAWTGMIQRCTNPNASGYPNWGGRGIAVSPEWVGSFDAFLAHVGERPSRDYSLDRIDVDGHYEPGNVRWADSATQHANTRMAQRDACVHGHQFTDANTSYRGTTRLCRACQRERQRRYVNRQRLVAA
jgi:hypothetical protein